MKTENSFDENKGIEEENLSEFIDKKVSYFCKKCDYSGNTEANVIKHVKKVHPAKKIKKLDENNELKNQKQSLLKRKPQYKCAKCNFKASRVIAMRNHVALFHGLNLRCGEDM